MKTITLFVLALVAVGCLQQDDSSTDEQAVCRDDPDTCPGGHPYTPKQETIDEANGLAASQLPEVPISQTAPICVGNSSYTSCRATVNFALFRFEAQCTATATSLTCEYRLCTSAGCGPWTAAFAPPTARMAETDLCNENPDTCPGGHAFTSSKEMTSDYVADNYDVVSDVGCNSLGSAPNNTRAVHCYASAGSLRVDCYFFWKPDGSLDDWYCYPGPNL